MNNAKESEFSISRKAYLRQFVSNLTGYILLINVGANLAWSSPAIPYLTNKNSEFALNAEQGAWITSILSLSSMFGYLINSLLMDRIGRRFTLFIFALGDLLSWILVILAHNYTFLLIARFFIGLSLGGTYGFTSPYIGEITERKIRGKFLVIGGICMNLGGFLINSLGAFFQYDTMNIIMIALPIFAICLFPLMLETPYYHLMRDQDEKAIKVQMKLSNTQEMKHVMSDIERMKSAMKIKNSGTSSLKLLFSDRGSRKALIVVLFVYMTYAFSGAIAIQAYTQTILKESDSSLAPKFAAMIIAGVQIFAGLPSSQLIDHLGRRPVYLFSGIMSAISLTIVSSFFLMKKHFMIDVSSVSWLPLVGIVFYQFMCSAGITVMPNVLIGELFSFKVKGVAVMIASNVMSLLFFGTKMMVPLLSEAYGIYTTFYIFSSVCLIGPIIVFCIVPETKGKSLEEVLELMSIK